MPKNGIRNFDIDTYTHEDANDASDENYTLFPNWMKRLLNWGYSPEQATQLRDEQQGDSFDELKVVASLEAENQELKKANKRYEAQIKEKSEKETALKEAILQLKKSKKKSQSIIQGQSRKINSLVEQLNQLMGENADQKILLKQLSNENIQSKKANEQLAARKQQLDRINKTNANNIKILENEITKLRENNSNFEVSNAYICVKTDQAYQEIEQAGKEKDDLMIQLKILQDKYSKQREQLTRYQSGSNVNGEPLFLPTSPPSCLLNSPHLPPLGLPPQQQQTYFDANPNTFDYCCCASSERLPLQNPQGDYKNTPTHY